MGSEEPFHEDYMPDLFAAYMNYNDEELELLFNSTFANPNVSMGSRGLEVADTDQLINSIFSFMDESAPQEGPTLMTCALIFLYTASFVCGLVGNFVAFSVVFRCRRLNQTTIILLFSLLISDLLVVTVCLPFTMVTYVNGALVHGKVICKLLPFVQGASIFSGMFVLFVLIAQQFFFKSRWDAMRRVFSSHGTALIVVLSWASALVLSSPLLYVTELRVIQLMGLVTVTMCQEIWPHAHSRHIYNVFIFLLTYVIPGAAFGVAYVQMTYKRGRNPRQQFEAPTGAGEEPGEKEQQQQQEAAAPAETADLDKHGVEGSSSLKQETSGRVNARRLLAWLIGMFALLWLPYHIVITYLDVHAEDDSVTSLGTNVFPIMQWLALSNSAFRPLCYCLLGTDFRGQLQKGCCCLRNTEGIDYDADAGLFTQIEQCGHSSERNNSRFEEEGTKDDEVRDCVTVL